MSRLAALGAAVDTCEGTDGKVLTIRGRTPDVESLAGTVKSIEDTVVIRYD